MRAGWEAALLAASGDFSAPPPPRVARVEQNSALLLERLQERARLPSPRAERSRLGAKDDIEILEKEWIVQDAHYACSQER